MKQKSVVTQRHTILQEREKTWTILGRLTIKDFVFLLKY